MKPRLFDSLTSINPSVPQYPDLILKDMMVFHRSKFTRIPFNVYALFLLFLSSSLLQQTYARKPHLINFRSPNLYPESVTWDPSAEHFIVGSLHHRSIHSVSDAGIVETLISDTSLPPNATILGLAVDRVHSRILAAVHSIDPLPPFNALAAYDLRSGNRLFLSILPSDPESTTAATQDIANDVTVDFKGNAYVTNAAANFIWKVTVNGEASIFSKARVFTSFPVVVDPEFSFCGLNGITYISRGYLLVVQSNTGKMYKVDVDDGTAKVVLLNKDLPLADGIAVRRDGFVLVVSMNKLWFLKSDDSWGEGVVFDKTDLDTERCPTSVVVGGEDRAYVLYSNFLKGKSGEEEEREWFQIEEVRSERESKEENVWIYVLVGFGLAYFMIWRFQMRKLVQNMNKKHN